MQSQSAAAAAPVPVSNLSPTAEFDAILQAFRAECAPSGATEKYLVEQLARASTNTRHLHHTHSALITHLIRGIPAPRPTDPTILLGAAFHHDCLRANAQCKLAHAESLSDRLFHRTLAELRQVQLRCRAV